MRVCKFRNIRRLRQTNKYIDSGWMDGWIAHNWRNCPLHSRERIMAASGYFSCFLTAPILYVRRHITINKMCECVVKLNIHFFASLLLLFLLLK